MNNRRWLAGVLPALLLSAAVCSHGQTFKQFTIEEIFDIAERESSQLRPYFSAEEEAQHGISVARSERLPEVNASLSLSYIGDGFITKRNFSDYQKAPIPHLGNGLGVSVNQPLYAGGMISNGVKLAEMQSAAARFATEMKRNSLRFQLAGYYLDIYKFGNLRTVVEGNIAQANKMLAEMRARYDQGMALKNDITRYELLVANLDLELIKINNMLDVLNDRLVVTSGLPSGTVVVPDSAILARSLPLSGEDWWRGEAYDVAPSLKMARLELEMSRKSEEILRGERLPRVGLNAGWTIDGPILVEVPPINRNLSYWYAGIGVSYNISSLYKSNKKLRKSRVAVREAQEKVEALTDETDMQIKSDYVAYMEAFEELKTCEKSVELAERNYQVTSTRYCADMALITDLLDAANSKLEAESRLVNARINIVYYYYKLLFTSGKI